MGPTSIKLFTYRVGFGDCFLLRFGYPDRDRHVLIDFGSSAPASRVARPMERIARHLQATCGGALDAIVVTHRHSDHLSGFAGEPWEAIRACQPKLVLLPWTEDPRAAADARVPGRPGAGPDAVQAPAHRIAALKAMHEVAAAAMDELRLRGDKTVLRQLGAAFSRAEDDLDAESEERAVVPFGKTLTRQLAFLGQTNLPDLEPVRNLAKLPREFLSFAAPTRLEKLLPGVRVHVLGPPALEDCPEVARQRARDADEFWQLAARAGACAVAKEGRPFPRAKPQSLRSQPLETRWFLRRMNKLRGEELLQLVRILDKAMNNTSLVLLFEACGKKLLFPGDAQVESWSHALSKPEVRRLLAGVDVYKVGNHGSGNATPKTLWRLFRKKDRKGGLTAVLSTRPRKHPGVPRPSLVRALEKETTLVSTLTPPLESDSSKRDLVIETDVA